MLELLACSRVRRAAIASMLTGPKNIAALAETSSRTNTIHLIEPLLKAGVVARESGMYELTPTGRANAIVLQSAIDGIEVLQDSFWCTHDLSSIPDHLMARIGELTGGQVICPNDDLLKAQHNFIDVVCQAKEIFGVSSVYIQGWPEMIVAAIEAGATVRVVFTFDVFEKVMASALKPFLGHPRFNYDIREFQAAFTVADDMLLLGLFVKGGGLDPTQDFVCGGPKAAAWGRDLYNFYLNQ